MPYLKSIGDFADLDVDGFVSDTWRAHPTTVVFVTHDVDEALLIGDRVAVLGRAGEPLRALLDVPDPRVATNRAALRAEVIAALDHSELVS